MNRTSQRCLLGLGAVFSVQAFLWAANPRITAWNQTSSAVTIARQRAATCTRMTGTINPWYRAYSRPGVPLTPGTLVCDDHGNTGEVTTNAQVHYIRSAPPEILNKILSTRGLASTSTPIPSTSPAPPPNPQ
jgi:hypothetical protein